MSATESAAGSLHHEIQPYRAMSKTAMLSLTMGLVAPMGIIFAAVLVLPAFGLAAGMFALRSIGKYPEELSGKWPARVGVVLCGLFLAAGITTHSVVYATEVPEGYTRISFQDLQPTAGGDSPVSERAQQLHGKKVFVKGYIYPDGQRFGIKRFVLVRDMGTCCFGGQPKLTHMVEVTLEDPLRTQYGVRKLKLGGTFKVDTRLKPVSGVRGVYYQLTADHLQ